MTRTAYSRPDQGRNFNRLSRIIFFDTLGSGSLLRENAGEYLSLQATRKLYNSPSSDVHPLV